MQVFVDSRRIVLAVHEETQAVDKHAYDELGVGETRVIYLDDADVPKPEEIDGIAIGPRKMPLGWEDTHIDTVPATITNTQGKLALRRAGLLSAVRAAINAIPDEDFKEDALIKFDAANWFRADPLFDTLGASMSPRLLPSDIDNLFRAARDH